MSRSWPMVSSTTPVFSPSAAERSCEPIASEFASCLERPEMYSGVLPKSTAGVSNMAGRLRLASSMLRGWSSGPPGSSRLAGRRARGVRRGESGDGASRGA
eukprot:scaffold208429_cov30-Tisochrysis_lutea.AAC.4